MTRPTQLGRTFPLITATGLGGAGGSVDGTQPDGQFPGSGQVPTASGSNGWAWASNVAVITANTSNALLGPFVNFQSSTGVTFAVASNTLTISATGAAAGSSLSWFIVTDYGATGDGTTDDTSSINSAIAALNAAGGGVLYFPHPADAYKITAALTTITAPCVIRGDGAAAYPYATGTGSRIEQTSGTANVFTFTDPGWVIEDIAIINTQGSPSAGSAIVAASTAPLYARMSRIEVGGFYDCIDLNGNGRWALTDSFIYDPVRYGVRIRGADDGDQSISGCYFMSDTHDADAAIRQEGGGGLKIANTKVNVRGVSGGEFVDGLSVSIGAGIETGVLTVVGSSFENMTGDAIDIATVSTGIFGMVSITGCEFALYSNNTGRAVKITAASAGGLVAGGIVGVVIDGCTMRTDGTARAAIELTNTDRVTIGDIQLVQNFTSRYTSSGDTNTTDGGGVTDHGALTGLADDDHTQYVLRNILTTQGDLFARTTSHITRVAAGSNTGMALVTDLNYVEGVRWGNTVGEILITDTPAGSPLVFSDLIQNEAQDDLMYADP